MRTTLRLSVLALVALAACEPGTTTPDPIFPGPSFAKAAQGPTVVVTDEAGLNAALAAAHPGDVIGVDGSITLSQSVLVTSPGITVTSATPGAGLIAAAGWYIFDVSAPDVTISHLDLDAAPGSGAAWVTSGVDVGGDTHGFRFTDNTVSCGAGSCVFLQGVVMDALISDNHFTATVPTQTGVHLQGNATGAVVTGNTVVAEVASTDVRFGGIRVRDATGAVIRDNVVTGPWANGVSVINLFDADIAHNQATGSVFDGFLVIGRPAGDRDVGPFTFGANLYSSNEVTGAAEAGIYVLNSCGDVFRANRLSGNGVGAYFDVTTGDNIWQGNSTTVSDLGAFDCDDDGDLDPNAFTGQGLHLVHVPLGQVIRELKDATGVNVMR
jgi:hypothetical protein